MNREREAIAEVTRLTLRLPRKTMENVRAVKKHFGTTSDAEAVRRALEIASRCIEEGVTVSITDKLGTRELVFV